MTKLLLIGAFGALLTGCIDTSFHKEVWVTKDASGNVVSRVEHEAITQPLSAMPQKPEYIKGF